MEDASHQTHVFVKKAGQGLHVKQVYMLVCKLVLNYYKTYFPAIAICQNCVNGRCTAPDTCDCSHGWRGSACNEGK